MNDEHNCRGAFVLDCILFGAVGVYCPFVRHLDSTNTETCRRIRYYYESCDDSVGYLQGAALSDAMYSILIQFY